MDEDTDLTAFPSDADVIPGQSFYNPALAGSGTILEDGTYGDPEPDPTEVRGLGPDTTAGGRVVGVPTDASATPANRGTGDSEPASNPPAKKTTAKKAAGSGSSGS